MDVYDARIFRQAAADRIPQDDFNRLMRLFRFTSIPRYILVDRQGCIIDDNHNGYDGLEHALKALKQKEQR